MTLHELIAHHPKIRRRARWAFIHTSMIIFTCDMIAALIPAFRQQWDGVSHLSVAAATFLVTVAEYMKED